MPRLRAWKEDVSTSLNFVNFIRIKEMNKNKNFGKNQEFKKNYFNGDSFEQH